MASKEIDIKRTGKLTGTRFKRFIPITIASNLSVLILINVDSVIVGNLLGPGALSAVNLIAPLTLVVGALTMLVSSGFGTELSIAIGSNDDERINKTKRAGLQLTLILTIAMAIVVWPIANLMIGAYASNPDLESLARSYTNGILIAYVIGVFTTSCTMMLIAIGEARVIIGLSIIEGAAKIGANLLFISVFDMGVAGAGWGTTASNVVRLIVTIIYMKKKTDLFDAPKLECKNERKNILKTGYPSAINSLLIALQGYFINWLILGTLGTQGMVAQSIGAFCNTIIMVTVNSVVQAMSPVMGLLRGAEDRDGMKTLLNLAHRAIIVLVGILTVVMAVFPGFFFNFNGVKEIPEFGFFAIRLYCCYFIFKGINNVNRAYLINLGHRPYASVLSLLEMALLLAPIAFLLSKINGTLIYGAYAISGILTWFITFGLMKRASKKDSELPQGKLYLYTLTHENGVESAEEIEIILKASGIDNKICNRICIVIEEIAGFAVPNKRGKISGIDVGLSVKEDVIALTILDDAKRTDIDVISQKMVTNLPIKQYQIISNLADHFTYRYVMGMNYLTLHFPLNNEATNKGE